MPDVEADIRKLPYDDGVADEILAIHVVEHFYFWEAAPLLTEWKRVLKPGGWIALETPNLVKCAVNLLTFLTSADQKTVVQMGMWGFYGDPNWRDPAMCHKWGYWPESLAGMLHHVGFIDIDEQPAEFHQPARDFRMVARKPSILQ